MAVESDSGALTFAKTFVERMFAVKTSHEFAYELCKDMTVVSASYTPKPRVVSRLTVTRVMCNPVGTLHGGAISTLFDVCTTVALATARRWEGFGVTRTLSTTYLVAVFPGDEIEIEGEVLQMGKKMAHLVGKMTLVKNGKLVATNVHDKVSVDPQAVRFSQHSKL